MSAKTDPSSSDSKLSEQEFLKLRAEMARRSVAEALVNAKAALAGKIDPTRLARKHPVISIAAAMVGGFVAAAVAVPSREEQELRRLRRLHDATHPPVPPTNGHDAGQKPPEKPSLGETVLRELIALIKPIVLAAITAGIKSAGNPAPGPGSPASGDVKQPERS
jgi:hypothetical protein